MSDVIEIWLAVVGWEGLYEVSDRGRVRSLDRWLASRPGCSFWLKPGRLMACRPNARGYVTVTLSRPGREVTRKVHQLVMEAFVGPCPPGEEVRHGPGGKLDNRLINLGYGTKIENEHDRVRDGTAPIGSGNGRAILTEAKVGECRKRHAAGTSSAALAAETGVTKRAMELALTGKTWRHA